MIDRTLRHDDARYSTLLVVAPDPPASSILASALRSLGYSFLSVCSQTNPVDLPDLPEHRIILLSDTVSSGNSECYCLDLNWALFFRRKTPDCYLLLAIDNQTDSNLCAEAIELGINGFINIDVPDFRTLLADRIEETLLRFSSPVSPQVPCDAAWITNIMGIPACSKPMQDLAFRACQAASLDHPILIEADHRQAPFQLAHAIHKMDPRRSYCPFFAIGSDVDNGPSSDRSEAFCTPESFSNIINDYVHRMIHSGGGTLVFEDLSELTLAIQEKVYGVIQEKNCFTRCSQCSCQPQVRIISLTSQPLLPKVEQGHFHKGLYEYLSQLQLRIPPLCQRPEDVPLLINYFVQKYAQVYERAVNGIAPEVYPILQTIAEREGFTGLESIIRTSLLLKVTGSFLTATDLPDQINPQ